MMHRHLLTALFVTSSCLSLAGVAQADEEWDCTEEVDWVGHTWSPSCEAQDPSTPWECYVDYTETCIEQNSGRRETRSRTRMTGICNTGRGDCHER